MPTLQRMGDSENMFGDGEPPEREEDPKPSAAELEAAGQNSMFGEAPAAAPAPAAEAPKPSPAAGMPGSATPWVAG